MKPTSNFKLIFTLLILNIISLSVNAQWNYTNKPTGSTLESLFYLNDSNIWAVGSDATILNYNGSSWVKNNLTVQTSTPLHSVFFVDSTIGWAGGDNGLLLKYDGSKWNYSSFNTNFSIQSLFFLNDHQGWAVGNGSEVYTYDGTSWTSQSLPYYSYLRAVYFVDDTHGWAVGQADISGWGEVIYKYDGSSWTLDKKAGNGAFSDIFMINANSGWVVGDYNTIYKYDGIDWTEQPSGDSYLYNSFIAVKFKDENTGFALTTNGNLFKYDGISWAIDTTLNFSPSDLAITASSNAWAVGGEGAIFKKENSVWKSALNNYNNIQKVIALNANNQWLLSQTQILKNNNGQWQEEVNSQSGYFLDAAFQDSLNGWAITNYRPWQYTGGIWTQQNWDNSGNTYYMSSLFFTDSTHGWSVGYYGKILNMKLEVGLNKNRIPLLR